MNFIPISQPSITQKEIDYVTDAIKSGWVSSLGKYIDLFEAKFAGYCGVKYALSTSNGTTGLHLALVSLGIGIGDEVIIPDFTFIATANVVRHAGATPIMVDIDRQTLCIDPKKIELAITPKTKAIIPVHLYGHPANMEAISRIARQHNLKVIEDAAEAHGAEINGKRVGSFGNCGVFSFYGNKIITSGEGGMITTNDESLVTMAKHLRDHAMSKEKRYWHTDIGYNYRLTNIQAALGLAQLERINELLKRKKEIFALYREELQGISGLRLNQESPHYRNVYWMICVEIEGLNETKRIELMAKLKEKGIDSRPYFYPISDMPMYVKTKTEITHSIYQTGINLPSFFDMTDEQIRYICTQLKLILNQSFISSDAH